MRVTAFPMSLLALAAHSVVVAGRSLEHPEADRDRGDAPVLLPPLEPVAAVDFDAHNDALRDLLADMAHFGPEPPPNRAQRRAAERAARRRR